MPGSEPAGALGPSPSSPWSGDRRGARNTLTPVRPETRYARLATDTYLGYQVFGEGPRDIIFRTTSFLNIDLMWDEPSLARFLRRLAELGRVIIYNPSGSGVSDPLPPGAEPTLEYLADEFQAVMDAAHCGRAVLIGDAEVGAATIYFAATYPDRTESLVLLNSFARFLRDDDHPWGMPPELLSAIDETWPSTFGTGVQLDVLAPSESTDLGFREWWAGYQRQSMGMGYAAWIFRTFVSLVDVRPILGSIQAPTLVLHRRENTWIRVEHGRYLGERIPGATYAELAGNSSLFWRPNGDAIVDEIATFLTGSRPASVLDRVLATVLFTDIVGSTERAAQLGDARWREQVDRLFATSKRLFTDHGGREVKTLGDGSLAVFDGPGRAIRCAAEVSRAARSIGIELRVGLHTGETEIIGDDVGGIAVHIGSRICAKAEAGEILVSGTVKDLVVGSNIAFAHRGTHELRGVPGDWQLYAVEDFA